MRRSNGATWMRVAVVVGTALSWGAVVGEAEAKQGFALRLSNYAPQDSQTETTFDIDSGPLPQIAYRWQGGRHNVFVGLGSAKWERSLALGGRSELTWIPVDAAYRYSFFPDRTVSFYVGGGFTGNFYDATVDDPNGAGLFASESGYAAGLGPVLGVEFLANRTVRIELEAQYSKQLLDSGDLDVGPYALEVDMSGLRATVGLSFMFGD